MNLDLEQDVKGLLPEKDFDRRDFIWTALGASAALALSSSGVGAADHDRQRRARRGRRHDPGQGRATSAATGRCPRPAGPFPVVLVAAEIFGLNHYIKDVCRRLAKEGYYAIVPDLYTRKVDLTKITTIAEIMPIVNSKYDTELVSDYDATVDFARASGKARRRADGDHRLLPRRAHHARLRGGQSEAQGRRLRGTARSAVSHERIHARSTAMDRVAEIKVPVLGLYGAKDAGIPVETVEKFFAALKAAGTPAELVVYPDAGHGFHADFRAGQLPQGGRRRRLEADARLVQEVRGVAREHSATSRGGQGLRAHESS